MGATSIIDNILFILNCYQESLEQLMMAIASVTEHYPQSQLLIIWDGSGDESYNFEKRKEIANISRAKKLNIIQVSAKQRLKPSINGGLWTERYLKLGLQISEKNEKIKFLLQIDPETLIISPVNFHFFDDCIFTNIINHNNKTTVQGGAIGYGLKAAKQIVDSKLLQNKEFQKIKYTYVGDKDYFKEKTRISCQDAIVYEVATRLLITVFQVDEFSCYPHFMKHKIDPSQCFLHPVDYAKIIRPHSR